MKKIIVLFKTHLDLGFTDFAENVRRKYIEEYIPHALEIAKEMRGEKEGFIWTVGSWILNEALEHGNDQEQLTEAIEAGDIRWHGLPFTTHTELMDEGLFRYGVGISQKLDRQFGKTTIAAKMTDVPGHTRSCIPLMAEAGIRFLHIGVNPASTRPSVPTLFRWCADSGEEVLVMYNNDYGELTSIGDSGVSVFFAHTGDNHGPQSADAVRAVYKKLHEKYPEAELVAGTLEDVAEIAVQEKNLPVITSELGDTWIHGVGSDPGKVAAYRALLHLKDKLSDEEMQRVYKELLPVPEHTWGRDEKTILGVRMDGDIKGEHDYFVRSDFEAVRNTEKFQEMEDSWKEQRDYVNAAVSAISGKAGELAREAAAEYKRAKTNTTGWKKEAVGGTMNLAGFSVSINERGAVAQLERDGAVFADPPHALGQFFYEVLSKKEYDRFRDQYVISDETWAIEDFGKLGVEKAISEQERFLPRVSEIYSKENKVVVRMTLPERAAVLYGGMDELELLLELCGDKVRFDFAWFGKKATRVPEGAWMSFATEDRIEKIEKMGRWVNPLDVIENGNRHMHALDRRIRLEHTEWETTDAPLFCPGAPTLMEFTNQQPSMDQGFFMNLYNNTWGTNFRMWYDEDARFRFELQWRN